jgi:hypothetical protein
MRRRSCRCPRESLVDLGWALERFVERGSRVGREPDAGPLGEDLLSSGCGGLNDERGDVQVGRRGGSLE